jgi:sugar phosphate isomerase/epimerase
MKISLNGARLGNDRLTFLEFVDLAARHEFAGVDFGLGGAMNAATELGGTEALVAHLAEKGVTPAVFGLEVDWRKDEETFQSGLASLAEKTQFAQAIGASRCCTWILPAVNDDPGEWKATTAQRFAAIADIFADYGVRLGLEWVGPHHLRAEGENATGKTNVVYNLPTTLQLIEQIGRENVGLLVDSYHCYTTELAESDLAQLTDAQIVHVHINDAPKGVGVAGAKDGQRVLPGAGEIDLPGFLRGLHSAGYTGYIATEVLAPEPIAETAEEAAGKVRAALRDLGL